MRKARRFLIVLAAPLLCTMTIMLGASAMAGPAMAAPANPPGNGSFFQLESEVNGGLCAWESGTTTTLYLAKCSTTNRGDLWYNPTNDISEIANLSTGLCFSVNGTAAGVYLNPCVPGQTAQEWPAVGSTNEIQNAHTHYCMWQSVTSIQQRSSCQPSNTHDLWLLL